MGELSPLHWLLVIAIALLLFGTSKFTAVGKGIGEGIRNFKSAMKEGEEPKKKKKKRKRRSLSLETGVAKRRHSIAPHVSAGKVE